MQAQDSNEIGLTLFRIGIIFQHHELDAAILANPSDAQLGSHLRLVLLPKFSQNTAQTRGQEEFYINIPRKFLMIMGIFAKMSNLMAWEAIAGFELWAISNYCGSPLRIISIASKLACEPKVMHGLLLIKEPSLDIIKIQLRIHRSKL